ncbi:MAG: RNA methyltransferase [bacterium]|nr:RNA methyltransferase [bacterium]
MIDNKNERGDLHRPTLEIVRGPKVRIVLVSPTNPGNIGATARAMRVTGFTDLVLVNTTLPLDRGLDYAMAWGSLEILEKAKKVETLEAALENCQLAVATSARPRHSYREVLTPEEISTKLAQFDQNMRVAFVFGREDTGLTNEEMERCDYWSRIPSANKFPSYNLAQAVQIYVYCLFRAFSQENLRETRKCATVDEINWFYKRVREQLEKNGFVPRDGMEEFINHYRGLMKEMIVDAHACAFMHKMLDGLLGVRKK